MVMLMVEEEVVTNQYPSDGLATSGSRVVFMATPSGTTEANTIPPRHRYCTCAILYILYTRGERVHDPWTDDSHLPHNHASGDACAAFPKQAFNLVQVILKNGAAEVGSKLPAHFCAVSCVPDLIFSGLEEEVGQYHFYDALAHLPESYRSANPDF